MIEVIEAMDPLEPYRQMARSIRFVPPIMQNHRLQKQTVGTVAVLSEPSAANWSWSSSSAASVPDERQEDPSEHAAALIKTAVSQPTLLPMIPLIQENIGDRISRLSESSDRGFVPTLPEVAAAPVAVNLPVAPIEAPAVVSPVVAVSAEVVPEPADAAARTVQAKAAQPTSASIEVEARSPIASTKPIVKSAAKTGKAGKAGSASVSPKPAPKKKKGFNAKAK